MSITEDVPVLLGRDLTEAEEDRIDRLVALAVGLVEGAIPGFAITEGTATAEAVYPSDTTTLWTARYPIVAVDTLTVGGNAVDATTYRWDALGRVTLNSWSTFDRIDLEPVSSPWASLTYDFGFPSDAIPGDVSLVVAAMVASALRQQKSNPDGSQSIGVDGYNEAFGESAAQGARLGMVVPDGALRRWRRNRVVSVPLVGRTG